MYRFINKVIDYIGRMSPILIHTPIAGSFGNCAEEIFFGLLKAKRENKKILFLYPQNPFIRRFVANQILFHVQSPYSIQNKYAWFLGGWLLTFEIALMWLGTGAHIKSLRRWLRLIWNRSTKRRAIFDFDHLTPTIGRSSLWKPDGVNLFSWKIVEEQNWGEQYDEYVPPELMVDDHRRAEHLRFQMGIPLADWFVCLHVREAGFRGDVNNPRNTSIKNYVEGVKIITGAGGWVVRLGDPSMTPLPAMDRVIDYPHTRFKSELMDIYLISQCRFYLGTNSGPSDVATLFGKPMVLVNVTEWSVAYPVKKGDLEIIKHVFSTTRNRFLSIREIIEEPFSWQVFDLGSDEYVLVENTPEEIRDVIEEFLANPDHDEYSELQNAFNEGRRSQIHRWFDRPEPFERGAPEGSIFRMYRVAACCDSVGGTFGHRYLDQNWLVDNLEKSSFRPFARRGLGNCG